ncbi:MAG: hypothetical protein JWL63_2680 [Rhodocyclales bacterium]|nr:hypothetical protein [Rhodocyclales bacterium]
MKQFAPLEPATLGNLSATEAVEYFRRLLLCEARHAEVRPDAITISCQIYVSDGGIDAEVLHDGDFPPDSFLQSGLTGFQLKTGASFKPWQNSSLEKELVFKSGELASEVKRTLEANGRYVVACFGTDFTPAQREESRNAIAALFARFGFQDTLSRIEVLGQGQLAGYFDRYSSLRLSLTGGSDEGFLPFIEWSRHAHMANQMAFSEAQQQLVQQLQAALRGDTKHLRILGEPGIGKTRLVLEAVRADDLSSVVVYVPQGERFGQSLFFRQLLRNSPAFPMILVIDELSEREMNELWGHLKQRTGKLKLVSIDHGPNRSRDTDITCLSAPRLPDETVKAILIGHVGETNDIDRWVGVCDGSPRVAQAVGENLAANPEDILRPPATVPFWDRFLFGYSKHESAETRQVATLMRLVALFSRFGFEEPVSEEARYVASLVTQADPSITWPRFQEIIQALRERRVIQGSRTLFIVPWALHIYLWREYWKFYGRGFDFVSMLDGMPESLQGWFLQMFRYAHDSDAATIVKKLLLADGIFSDRAFLISKKGAAFLAALTEADPSSSLTLLEQTIGGWNHDELLAIDDTRQEFVRIVEMIAVWQPTAVRAINLLSHLAIAENSTYSNNATGTLLGLFRIGPEWAVTEASPSERLPALEAMLRSPMPELRLLGLKVAESSLRLRGGMRIIGAEHQGLKERAKLWWPQTQSDWCMELERYWDCVAVETRSWVDELRTEANATILSILGDILQIPQFEDSAFGVLQSIVADPCTDSHKVNHFFAEQGRDRNEHGSSVRLRLRKIAGRLARKDLESRFQRYVLDATWPEWDSHEPNATERPDLRARKLVRALAKRVAGDSESFNKLLPLLVSGHSAVASLPHFGEVLALYDGDFSLLATLTTAPFKPERTQCFGGYMLKLKELNPEKWKQVLLQLLSRKETAPLGSSLIWHSGFDENIFSEWVSTYESGWIEVSSFRCLCYGMTWQGISKEQLVGFLRKLNERPDRECASILVNLLDQLLNDAPWEVETQFVLRVVIAPGNFTEQTDTSHGYHWGRVCRKLVKADPATAPILLDAILGAMQSNYSLSYDHDVGPIAQALCEACPAPAWEVVTKHLLSITPKWRGDILHWLKGNLGWFGRAITKPPIAEFPLEEVLAWTSADPAFRAPMVAHAAAPSLDDEMGGALTRALLARYVDERGVVSGITANFHSGGWSGPESEYLRKKRNQFRAWLSKDFEPNVCTWIENEISYLDKNIEAAEIKEERESWNRPN